VEEKRQGPSGLKSGQATTGGQWQAGKERRDQMLAKSRKTIGAGGFAPAVIGVGFCDVSGDGFVEFCDICSVLAAFASFRAGCRLA
jgi:hypothetical protein